LRPPPQCSRTSQSLLPFRRQWLFDAPLHKTLDTRYQVHPMCARLAVSELLPTAMHQCKLPCSSPHALALTKLCCRPDNRDWSQFTEVYSRLTWHKNNFDQLGCSNPSANTFCLVFSQCWRLSLKRVTGPMSKYPECQAQAEVVPSLSLGRSLPIPHFLSRTCSWKSLPKSLCISEM
jgi:hypothetical protein